MNSSPVAAAGGGSDVEFRLPLDRKQRKTVLRLCDYDATTGTLSLRNSD